MDCKAPIGVLRTCLEHFLSTFNDPSLGARIEFGDRKGIPRKRVSKVEARLKPASYSLLPRDEHRRRNETKQQSIWIYSCINLVTSDDLRPEVLDCIVSPGFRHYRRNSHVGRIAMTNFLK